MAYQLSQRSLDKLQGVDPRLVSVVKRAIEITTVDFGVTEGLRTPEKQLEYYNRGASQIAVGGTHVEGKAVDLMAYWEGKGSWDLSLYDNIADAMKQAAIELGVPVRWGAAWHINDIRTWNGTMQAAMDDYCEFRRKQGRKPFIDGPHFEIGS